MRSGASFPWPVPPGFSVQPQWNGRTFDLGGETSRVLAYAADSSHWSEDLTALHESMAGPNHPIDQASRRLAVASMQRLPLRSPVILDAGCSSGYVLEALRTALPAAALIGSDYLRGPLESLGRRMPEIPILQFDLRKAPLPDACLDGVTCLNVLEHIDDDATALAEIHRMLKPGGIAHIEVPAGPSLYDIYDQHLLHHRRYQLSALVAMATRQGFAILKSTHLGALIYPAFYYTKRRNQKMLTSTPAEIADRVSRQIRQTRSNPLFRLLMTLETMAGRLLAYPFGIRCVVALRKS